MNTDLSSRHAFVCGSTEGIGRAAAFELASLGAQITLIARNEEKLKKISAMLPAIKGGVHDYICADFSDPAVLKNRLEDYLKNKGGGEILINNTGGPKAGPITEAQPEQFTRAFSDHIVCNQILTQALIPFMKKAGYGRIINIVSTSVREPIPGLGVSNTIRAAVAGWAKTMSSELAPFGITVNNVLPGYTNTGRLESLIRDRAAASGKDIAFIEAEMRKQIPAGRFASPEEIAAAIAFLASPAANYITGVSLPVDGGRTACI